MFMRFGMPWKMAMVISPHSCTPNSQPFIDKSYVSWIFRIPCISDTAFFKSMGESMNQDFPEDMCSTGHLGANGTPMSQMARHGYPMHSPIKSHSIPAFKNLQTPLVDYLNSIYPSKVPMLPGHFFGSKVNRTNSWWIGLTNPLGALGSRQHVEGIHKGLSLGNGQPERPTWPPCLATGTPKSHRKIIEKHVGLGEIIGKYRKAYGGCGKIILTV